MTLTPNMALMRSPLNYVTVFLMVTFALFSYMLLTGLLENDR